MNLGTDKNAVVVPSQAVQTGQQGQFVYVIRPDLTADVRAIVPGERPRPDGGETGNRGRRARSDGRPAAPGSWAASGD